HALTAYQLAKDPQTKLADMAQRARLVGNAGLALAQFKLKLKQDAEAVAVLEELLRFGLSAPAAHVYADAAEMLAQQGHADAATQALAASATTEAAAPEIGGIIDWIDQKPATLASLRGRVVLLDFWATWCGPCQMTMPKLRSLHEKYKNQGLVVIGVTQLYGRVRSAPLTPEEELGYLRAFKKEMHLSYGFAVSNNDANELHYGVQSIPTAVLIDRKGHVRFITVGATDTNDDALGKAIKKLLAEQ
ncbi:MAG TPA: TlpA disulfide reductase family protein, partial [Pyrinomonadaceae bacterium]|nr:TlpA disulfide reductase family protein [Pyrinomonadaceae bacterium]